MPVQAQFELETSPKKRRPKSRKPHFESESKIVTGDARQVLEDLPEESVQCCITSPPYWGLRDYGISGQIGAEMKLDDYITDLVTVFDGVRRVLKSDGTLWLNLGDSYTSGGRKWRQADKKNPARGMSYRAPTPDGLKPKDLIGVPWRVAFALQEAGWYLRSDVVWHKQNGLPESVKDRPSRVHEYLFLFSKSQKYSYHHESVKEPAANGKLRNCRSVWTINTEAFKDAHFATFPTRLVEKCLLAGTQAGEKVLDPFFGSGTVGVVAHAHERSFLGVELNPEYVQIARKRLDFADA